MSERRLMPHACHPSILRQIGEPEHSYTARVPGPTFLSYRRLLTDPGPVDPLAMRVSRVAGEEKPRGEFVLYWARSARRLHASVALDHAIARANEAGLPVVVCESLRPD